MENLPEFDIVGKLKAFAMEMHSEARKCSNPHVVRRVADRVYEMAEYLHVPLEMPTEWR